jgi:cation:H+ antiporter
VLLAGATSPELSVDVSAVLNGLDDIAVGDLLGSSLFNLLIPAAADLVHKKRGWMLSRAAGAHAISGVMSMLLTAVVGVVILSHLGVSLWGIGAGSAIVFVAYALTIRIIYYDQRLTHEQSAADGTVQKLPPKFERRSALRRATLRFALAAVGIVGTAPFVADAAGKIAELSGLGGTFIGTTLVAFSTSLPELVSTIAAGRLGAFDLASASQWISPRPTALDCLYHSRRPCAVGRDHPFGGGDRRVVSRRTPQTPARTRCGHDYRPGAVGAADDLQVAVRSITLL